MALSLFGRKRHDPFESIFDSAFPPIPSLFQDSAFAPIPSPFQSMFKSFFQDHTSFARDVRAVANTQVDWNETQDAHVFRANLPGLAKEDVKVVVEDGRVLQISGERKKEETSSNDKWHRVERAYGGFLRRFRLPDNAKIDELKAQMENGVLTVTVPKLFSSEPRNTIKSIKVN